MYVLCCSHFVQSFRCSRLLLLFRCSLNFIIHFAVVFVYGNVMHSLIAKSPHLFIEELSIPCVIQGWRLIYLRDVLTFFSGKALSYACLNMQKSIVIRIWTFIRKHRVKFSRG